MSKLKIHFLQHVPFEGIGCIDYWIQAKGHSVSFTNLFEVQPVYSLFENFDWLIIMGGPISVNDTEKYPWLIAEKKFIETAIKKNKVVIGICLGCQLVANALGAKVYPNEKKEIGWFPVKLTDAAKQNEIFNFLPGEFTAFQWHGETFDLPKHATLLMTSAACTNQAFIYGKRTAGFQFHIESTQAGIKEMIEHCGAELVAQEFVQTELQIMEQIENVSANHEHIRLLLNKISESW